ncbi:MAG TPA: DUF1800 domain-containing protein [Stellaceae bacterium]|nr:DUF1800 domain-containing protein [Stellaceae bacterium]
MDGTSFRLSPLIMASADLHALIAATRFGLGPRAGELQELRSDPRGALLRQLNATPSPLPADLPPSATMVAMMLEARRDKEEKPALQEHIKTLYRAEITARTKVAVMSEAPFLERLTRFWSNHFTVSGRRPLVRGMTAAFEREAIRPHITGRFSDLLLAVARHPAMLLYLDNAVSVGPQSRAGRLRNKGLNENFARETLELHTLGVDGGYTQADVEALARILTGWSIARLTDPDPGTFRFHPEIHEPGAKILLGKNYDEAGIEEGETALRALAAHPATARHIAGKLARHFIADDPPADAVAHLAAVFEAKGGDLPALMSDLVRQEWAWRKPFTKLRTPEELVVAACRATGIMPETEALLGGLRFLDQPCFFAPSPAGWPDVAAGWVSPEAVLRRAQWCESYAERLPDPPDPTLLAKEALGPALPPATAASLAASPDRRMGLALLLASPEFQRR